MAKTAALRVENLPAPEPGQILVSLETAASAVDVSHWLLRKKIREGELEPFRMKNSPIIRVRIADVVALFEAGSGPSDYSDEVHQEQARKEEIRKEQARKRAAKARQIKRDRLDAEKAEADR
ncbi:hypothetical protein OG921_13030 [Aldersonia sp. NBC_00410]|uniref:hypothetical protein n=1 Tax=Aldersonia sp. NBC_00410 TaxID=2975954 RepID=UPI00225B6A6C|nr:hypothetical protein [Aldersonia sp. NBC_00410]MCX5044089.1 hypothetical protein [Aldersonia sp. NBC_00410]